MDSVGHEPRDRVAWVGSGLPRGCDALDTEMPHGPEAASRRARHAARAPAMFDRGPCPRAGFDLAGHRAREPEAVFHDPREWHRVCAGIRRGGVPAIAAPHGAVAGGGLEPAPTCPRWGADTSASFAPPRGRRSIHAVGASVHTALPMGASRMADPMPTGRVPDAAAAERAGPADLLGPRSAPARAGEPVAGMAPLTVLGAPRAPPCVRSVSEEDGLFVESMRTALAGAAAASGPADPAGECGAKAALPGGRTAAGDEA